jgi:ABC-2 type transport system ATP-binding protein
MINVQDLTKDYGTTRAIDSLNFTAEKGEVLGFLGPNGAGKTTTIRILTGFMPPTSGSAQVGGHDVIAESLEVRKLVGYLPETVPLYEDMRVFDYLKFMADLRHIENAEERVEEILEIIGLEERSQSFIKSISKGMRQRVGLGQAMIHKPDVLILDEPTIGLDPKQIIEVRNLIKEIGKEKTVLLSTHILSEAQQICDRVLIINKGLIVAEDAPENLQARLSGLQKVNIRVRNNAENALDLIRQINGVVHAELTENGAIHLENAVQADPRAEIARQLVSRGYDLLELTPEIVSLEDIFLKLTREEPETTNEASVEATPNSTDEPTESEE